MAHLSGWCEENLHREFTDWWQNEKCEDYLARIDRQLHAWDYKSIVNYSKRETGSHARVFPDCYDENGKMFAMKLPLHRDMHGKFELYVEYKIHKRIYELCGTENNRFIKPLWIKKVTFNRGFHTPDMAIGFERIDSTFYEHIMSQKSRGSEQQRDEIFKWKDEIISTLKKLHTEYGFFHRDCHLSNIAIVDNDWKFFDLGMSRVDDCEPVNGGFYRKGCVPSLVHDERIFRSSFSSVLKLEKDEWEKAEDYIIVKSDAISWESNMPVVVFGHPQSENGTFQFITESGAIVVDLDVHENTKVVEVKSKINPTTKYVKQSENKCLTCHFKKKNVLPDVLNHYVYYYIPTLK